jgi:predicted Zn-dependent protease
MSRDFQHRGYRIALVSAAFVWWGASALAQTLPPTPAQIEGWVEQLGSDEYAARQQAYVRLQQVGFAALPPLHRAARHEDFEIAAAAAALIESVDPSRALESRCPETHAILQSYFDEAHSTRFKQIRRLAEMGTLESLLALAHIAQWEPTRQLAGEAVAVLITQAQRLDPATRRQLAEGLIRLDADSGIASGWLAGWSAWAAGNDELPGLATFLRDPSIGDTSQVPTSATSVTAHDVDVSRAISDLPDRPTCQLLIWYADQQLTSSDAARAAEAARLLVDVCRDDRGDVSGVASWLVARRLWEPFDALVARYQTRFNDDPWLAYHQAQAQLERGNVAAAQTIAARATDLSSGHPAVHLQLATLLDQVGFRRWAETEYRYTVQHDESSALDRSRACLALAELWLADDRWDEAGELLERVLATLEKADPGTATASAYLGTMVEQLQARRHYVEARRALHAGDEPAHVNWLIEGLAKAPTDTELLIALYESRTRIDDPSRVTDLVDAAAAHLDAQIRSLRGQIGDLGDATRDQTNRRALAEICNRYAWLVARTDGDIERAQQAAELAVSLQPATAAYHDTLALCRFRRGDVAGAVASQQEAVRLKPHDEAFQAALAQYVDAL